MSIIRKTFLFLLIVTIGVVVSCSGISLSGSEIGNPGSEIGNPVSANNGFFADHDTLADTTENENWFTITIDR
jgi:hypothetical protein